MPFERFMLRLLLASTAAFTVAFVIAVLLLAIALPVVNYRPIYAIRNGLVAGILFAVIIGLLDSWRRRAISKKYGVRPDYDTNQQRRLGLPNTSARAALAQIKSGMETLPWLRPETITVDGSIIRAVTKASMASFSERLSISVNEIGSNETTIVITSAPRSLGTIVDYGKGVQNVEELKRAIEEWLR
jgi:hypothetical protein